MRVQQVAKRRPAPAVDVAEAEEFLRLFHAENPGAGSPRKRLDLMHYEVDTTGTYRHTEAELAFGPRVAWRNSARCIGRLYWKSLKVRDLRDVHSAAGVAAECVKHLRAATNGGKIRPLISVFPPDTPQRPAPRIWSAKCRWANPASGAQVGARICPGATPSPLRRSG